MALGNLLGAFEGPELLIILALVFLFFGGSKLPQLARSLGQAKKEFHSGMDAGAANDQPPTTAASTAPALTPAPGSEPVNQPDTVTISRQELERLRAAAKREPGEPR